MTPQRHTLVLSDIHLCGIVPDGATCMRYRERACQPDASIAALINAALKVAGNQAFELVLNGDIFDFDAPDLPTTSDTFLPAQVTHESEGAAAKMVAILGDHPVFVDALQRVLAAGHRVVFVPGNHDAQVSFPSVRRVLRDGLHGTQRNVIFRTWFHRTADGVHIEHGHQYDPLCALHSMLPQVVDGQLRLEDTIGSTVSYFTPMLPGCPSPREFDPFGVDIFGIVKNVFRSGAVDANYLRWHAGVAAQTVRALGLACTRPMQPTSLSFYSMTSAETGAQHAAMRSHENLFAARLPIEQFLAEEGWRSYGPDIDRRVRDAMDAIARTYGARGVLTGHTHMPYGHQVGSVFMGNSGTWSCETGTIVGQYIWIVSSGSQLNAMMHEWPREAPF